MFFIFSVEPILSGLRPPLWFWKSIYSQNTTNAKRERKRKTISRQLKKFSWIFSRFTFILLRTNREREREKVRKRRKANQILSLIDWTMKANHAHMKCDMNNTKQANTEKWAISTVLVYIDEKWVINILSNVTNSRTNYINSRTLNII